VSANDKGEYEIWDCAGIPIVNVRPALWVDVAGSAASVVQCLVHLAKYHATQQLRNQDDTSPLKEKLWLS
jgi:hypothetical protein